MKALRGWMLAIAIIQAVSTLIGFVQLLIVPEWYAPILVGTAFEGSFIVPALLLGLIVGGAQWAAIAIHLRAPRWLALGYTIAGCVMIGWIAGECLILDTFWLAHAVWGGLGVIQLLLPLVLLGVLNPLPERLAPVARSRAASS